LGSVYGFGSQNLPSPQGVLIESITKGIFEGDIDWKLINIGGTIALVIYMLGIPVLPFAVGLYLPLSLSGGLLLGGFIAKVLKGERENILPSGMIAGDGLISIIFAFGIGFLGWNFPEASQNTAIFTIALIFLPQLEDQIFKLFGCLSKTVNVIPKLGIEEGKKGQHPVQFLVFQAFKIYPFKKLSEQYLHLA
jgi:hypothetical protein